jgi:integrase
MSRVKIGNKFSIRPGRILTDQQTIRVLAQLHDPNLLIPETALATGARISEPPGLTWGHVDLRSGVIQIVQRNRRGDVDRPKSRTSKRPLALGYLVDRYRARAIAEESPQRSGFFTRTDGSGIPLGDSGVRQALKRARWRRVATSPVSDRIRSGGRISHCGRPLAAQVLRRPRSQATAWSG